MEETAQNQYVEFIVNDVLYAITIDHVHEIIRMQEVTPIPNHKSFVKGVINLRGKVLPVVDLRSRMGLESAAYTRLTRILVINTGTEFFGAIVDQVNRVTTLEDIVPPPEYALQTSKELTAGIAQEKDTLINIIMANQIFVEAG